jgi:predicted RNase H-like nuclease (RuvC/YqgF family)
MRKTVEIDQEKWSLRVANTKLKKHNKSLEKDNFELNRELELYKERLGKVSSTLASFARDYTVARGRNDGLRRIIMKQSNISAWLEEELEEMLQEESP